MKTWPLFFIAALFSFATYAAEKPAVATDQFLAEHRRVRAGNPKGVNFEIRLLGPGKKFKHGEPIRIALEFSSEQPSPPRP